MARYAGEIVLCPATEADKRIIFEWRNDPFLVNRSSSRRRVTWEEHAEWFASSLADPGRKIYIIVKDGEKAGQVRFDRMGEAACVISIYLLKRFTGNGYGLIAMAEGIRRIFETWDVREVIACVRKDNPFARSAFLKAGFERCAENAPCPEEHAAFVFKRPSEKEGGRLYKREFLADDRANMEYYARLVETHGHDVRSLDWGGRESQELRFHVLSRIGPLQGARVLDVGCGLGDLYGWMRKNGLEAQYTGIDITAPMLAAAREKYPGAGFELRNLLAAEGRIPERSFDYVLASGLFTFRKKRPFEFMKAMIFSMYRACRKGVAFNSLSAWAHRKESGEFHADPLETLVYCRGLTPWVALRHDYHPNDFTIYMRRERDDGRIH